MGEVIVRLDKDQAEQNAPLWNWERLTDIWYYMLGPVLPFRHHTLSVQLRQEDGSYQNLGVMERAGSEGLPDWVGEFSQKAHEDYENALSEVEEGGGFNLAPRLVK